MTISEVKKNFFNTSENESDRKYITFSSDDSLKIKIVSEPDDLIELKEEWNELVDKSSSTIFQSFTWNKTWWKYFGENKSLFVILVYHKDLLTGILPCFIDTIKLFGHKFYSCLRLLGTSVNQPEGEDLKGLKPYSDYLDMIVRPGYEEIFSSTLVDFLIMNSFKFNEIIFEEVRENSAVATYLLPLLDKKNISYTNDKLSACPVASLESTWEEYLKTMSKRRRNHVRKYIRNVSDPEVKIFELKRAETKKQVSENFEELVALHQSHWNSIGQPGVFAEKRYHQFLKEATSQLFTEGCVWLNTIHSTENEEKIVAIDLHFVYKERIYLLQRAYDSSSDVHTNSPGTVLLYNTIRQGIRKNFKYFDFLRGEDKYKYRTANSTIINRKITVSSPDLPVKFYHRIIRKIPEYKRKARLEIYKMKVVAGNKNFINGISEYIHFLQRRIRSH